MVAGGHRKAVASPACHHWKRNVKATAIRIAIAKPVTTQPIRPSHRHRIARAYSSSPKPDRPTISTLIGISPIAAKPSWRTQAAWSTSEASAASDALPAGH
jgi:hypothetical protein